MFFWGLSPSYAEHAGELGYCALCDTPIMEKVGYYIKPNKEYHEVWFEFSSGSKGKVAFCSKHFKKLSKKDFPKIMGGIKRGWEKEFIVNNWTKEQIEKYKKDFFNVTIVRKIDEKDITDNK